jgi:5-hydroxyisourate hydrolase-like protein (transthyretin family)
MNLKTLKQNPIASLALILLLTMPMVLSINFANAAATGTLSAVESGTTNSTWTVGPDPNPIGSTLLVDLTINDASGVYGWFIPSLTWNPYVLKLESINKGTYMGTSGVVWIGNTTSNIDNVNGLLRNGVGAYRSSAATGTSGVLATLRFTVLGNTGTDNITLSDSTNTAVLYQAASRGSPVNTIANNATITLLPTTPTGVISATQAGTTTSSWSIDTSQIAEEVQVDINIDSAIAKTIWGWSVNVNWNPQVLRLTSVTKGDFLEDGSHGTSFIGSNPAQWDQDVGKVMGGIACADSASQFPVTSNTEGVLASLTFEVVGYGTSDITLSNGNLRTYSGDTVGVTAPTSSATFQAIPLAAEGVISAVQSGTLDTSAIPVNMGEDTVAVDVRIDGAANVWGWAVKVNWDPSVLQLADVWEGDFLMNTDMTFFVGNNPGQWDNVIGAINGGMAASLASGGIMAVRDYSDGVLATLVFNVIGSEPTAVTLSGGNLRSYSSDTWGTAVTTNSATITIERLTTELTVNYVPDTVNKYVPESATITGTLTSSGTGVDGMEITLYRSDPILGQVAIGTAVTEADGSYTYTWTPETSMSNGYYLITAEFAGDSTYASSSATSLPPGLFILPEYALGALVAIFAALAAFASYEAFKKGVSIPTLNKRIK